MASSVNTGFGSDDTAVTEIQTLAITSVAVDTTFAGNSVAAPTEVPTTSTTRSDIWYTFTPYSLRSTVSSTSQNANTFTPAPTLAPFVNNDTEKQTPSPEVPIGAIVGGLIGCVLLLMIAAMFCLFRRNRRRRELGMRQILPPPSQAGSAHPIPFLINHNSAHPELLITTSDTISRSGSPTPLVLVNPEETVRHNKPTSNTLPKKKGRSYPRDASQKETSDKKSKFGDHADSINVSETTPDTPEEVRLLRVLVRAIEERPQWLSALVGEEINMRNTVADPPPGYEETNSLLSKVNR